MLAGEDAMASLNAQRRRSAPEPLLTVDGLRNIFLWVAAPYLPEGRLSRPWTGFPLNLAGFGEEALLLQVAGAFEEALPWIDRRPPVHVSS
jgi:hypothetical protein